MLLLRALEPPWFNQYVMKYFLLLIIIMMMMMMMLMDEADTLQHRQKESFQVLCCNVM
jgi:hypothetical protein